MRHFSQLLFSLLVCCPLWVMAQVDGGTVATEAGETTVYTCPGDMMADLISFDSTTTSTANYAYVVTDDNNIILGLPPGDMVDFEGAGVGNCRLWGLSYTGNITAMMGDDAAAVNLSDGMFQLSSNWVTVVRDTPVTTTVATAAGETRIYTCPGDGMPDLISFDSTSTSNANFQYVITDDNNIILGLPPGDMADFEGAGVGNCRVWGLSYTGNITAMMGDDAAAVTLTDGCFQLSSNWVTVVRDVPVVTTVATETGATMIYTCPGDGIPDLMSFDSVSTSNANFQYVVTDDNNIILGLPPGDMVDFEGAGTGNCRVWGLSYTGNITAMMGDDAAAVTLTDGCFELSSNFVTVIRDVPVSGMVSTESGETTVYTCPGDGNPDIISFDSTNATNSLFQYVITDDNNIILGLPPGDMADFEGAGVGNCRVWGLSYTGNITAMMGDDAAAVMLTDGCFELSSNWITVVRDVPATTTVSSQSGATTIYTCPGDGMPDLMRFDSVSTSNSNFQYVVTDDNNIILGLPPGDMVDFEGAGVGNCRVWGLSYTGNITAMMGDDAAAVTLTDGCFELSSNWVTVVRDVPVVTTVATQMGATMVYTCPGDGIPDLMRFDSVSTSNANFQYVVTDDNNIILGLPPGDMVDFDGAGVGNCRVWGLSYTGNITAMMGDDAAAVTLTDGCFELSSNFVTIFRDVPTSGTVSAESGATTIYTCPGDGNPDLMRFDSTNNTNSLFQYVVTDDNNIILGLPPGDMVDFEGAGFGNCRVWGLSYTGSITAMMGDDAAAVTLTDGCFELSSNFVTVVRDTPVVTTVAIAGGATEIDVCPSDGIADEVEFESVSTSMAAFQYVVTDENNIILGLPPGNIVDFEGAGNGICRVWGLSYTGNIIASAGDDAATVNLTDGCFKLSSNFVTVNRDSAGAACATSVRNIEDNFSLRLYPNPVSSNLNIDFRSADSEPVQVRVMNITGAVVSTQVLQGGQGNRSVSLTVNDYPSGIYIVNLLSGNSFSQAKFLVP